MVVLELLQTPGKNKNHPTMMVYMVGKWKITLIKQMKVVSSMIISIIYDHLWSFMIIYDHLCLLLYDSNHLCKNDLWWSLLNLWHKFNHSTSLSKLQVFEPRHSQRSHRSCICWNHSGATPNDGEFGSPAGRSPSLEPRRRTSPHFQRHPTKLYFVLRQQRWLKKVPSARLYKFHAPNNGRAWHNSWGPGSHSSNTPWIWIGHSRLWLGFKVADNSVTYWQHPQIIF